MCRTCKGREGAHYGWCSQVGGPGYKPGSVEAAIAAARRAGTASTESPSAGQPAASKPTTNGWSKPRLPAGSSPGVKACPPDVLQAGRQTRRQALRRSRAGKEIRSKEVRRAVNAAIGKGWEYQRPGAKGAHARLYSPDGKHIVVFAGNVAKGRGDANAVARINQGVQL